MINDYFDFNIPTSRGSIITKVLKTCKYCNTVAVPKILWYPKISEPEFYKVTTEKEFKFSVVYFCPHCEKEFLLSYKLFRNEAGCYETTLKENKPDFSYLLSDLPREIEQISKKFRQIYSQSLIAEKENLDLIAGVGFRKSVEFLVKDYLINLLKEDEKNISKMPLSRAINMIENTRIKSSALAATWLGNDETHYEKKYTDKDINDMKRFIKTLTYHIASEIHAIEAIDFIVENK